MTRLDAAKSLEVGEWLVAHKDILQAHTRLTLADMASKDLGYDISASTIDLQGKIRNLVTGRPYTPRAESEKKDANRLDKMEEDIRALKHAFQSLLVHLGNKK
jgi:hypothetical protein